MQTVSQPVQILLIQVQLCRQSVNQCRSFSYRYSIQLYVVSTGHPRQFVNVAEENRWRFINSPLVTSFALDDVTGVLRIPGMVPFLHHLQSMTSQCVLGIPSMVPLLHHSLLMTSLISCITYWWRHNVVLRIPGSSAEDNCLVSSKTVVEAVARQDNSLPTADLKLN